MKVTYGPLSEWQKTDCINRSAEYDCPFFATLEAQLDAHGVSVRVRCCEDTDCMERAAELVLVQYNTLRQ